MTASFYLTAPASSTVGELVSFRIGLEPGADTIGAVGLSVTLTQAYFSDVVAQPLAFAESADTRSFQLDGSGDVRVSLCGVSLSNSPGPIDLIEVTARLNGVPGRGAPIALESLGAVSLQGIPLFVPSRTSFLFAEHGPVEVIARPLWPTYAKEAYQSTFHTRGGRGEISWAHTDGALPPGCSFAAAGYLSGTPTTPGSYSFELTATATASDGQSSSSEQWFTLSVRAPLLHITTNHLPPAASDVDYQVDLQHSGGETPILWTATHLPPGLSVSGAKISGRLSASYQDFGVHTVEIEAQDAAAEPQLVRKTLSLATVPIAPLASVSAPGAASFAVARDLYATQYEIRVSALVLTEGRDADFIGGIQDAKDAILQELFVGGGLSDAGFGQPLSDDQLFWESMQGVYGDGGGEGVGNPPGSGGPGNFDDLVGYQPEPDGGSLPDPSLPGARSDDRARAWQLLQLYNELDEMAKGNVSFNLSVDVLLDDIRALTFHFGIGPSSTVAGPAAGLYGVYPPVIGIAMNAVYFMTGGWLLRSLRVNLDSELEQRRQRASDHLEQTEHQRPTEAPPQKPAAQNQVYGATIATRLERRVQKNRVFAVVGPLLTVAAVVGSFVYGGLGAVALALAVAGSAVAAAKRSLNQRYQGNLKFVGDAIDVIVQKGKGKSKGLTGGKHSDSVTVFMTPGSHRLSVRWFGKMVATSRYGAANSLGSFLNYQVNIAPVNDENWPRFTGPDVEVIGSGSVLSGSNDYPVSLTGSELDVLVVYPEARVPDLIPAKAKSVYAEPRPFPEPWPEYRLDEPPIIDLVAVAQLDEYGRRSVLLAGNQRAVVWTNRIGGFRGRTTYVEELGNQRARGIVAADLNGDQWRHVFFAFDQQVIAIGPIKPEPIDNQLLTALSSHLFSSGGSVMGLAGVSDIVSSSLLELPDSVDENAHPVESLLTCFDFESEVRLHRTVAGTAFADTSVLLSLATPGPIARPSSLILTQDESGAVILLLALWQGKQIARWRRLGSDSWQALETIALTFRPRHLYRAPPGLQGIVIAADDRLILLREPGADTEDITTIPLYTSTNALVAAASDDAVAILNRETEIITIFA